MRFYNVDMKGKFFVQRGSALPSADPSNEGRLFYNETNETMYLHDASGWGAIASTGGVAPYLRKDMDDSTPYDLGVKDLTASGDMQSLSLHVTGTTAQINGNNIWHAGNDGPGSGLNADLLDNQSSDYFRNASNMNAGTLPSARLSGTYNINITGSARYA